VSDLSRCVPRSRRVVVTAHAAETAAERAHLAEEQVRAEVAAALDAGRFSRTRPRFIQNGNRQQPSRWRLFAWDRNEERCYVVVKRDGEVVVLTTLTPLGDFMLVQGPGAVAQAFKRAGHAA
jgi:hypothetical protein